MPKFAGVELRDIHDLMRMASLQDEVLRTIHKMTSRRSRAVSIFDVISEITENAGVTEGDVQTSLDKAYKNRYISIDSHGFVRIIDAHRERLKSRRMPQADNGLKGMVSRLNPPSWVVDSDIWLAVMDSTPVTQSYWNNVTSEYRRRGGRTQLKAPRTASVTIRPFDVHPPIWKVEDGMLQRDLSALQAMIIEGSSPEELLSELIDAGADRRTASKLIDQALSTTML